VPERLVDRQAALAELPDRLGRRAAQHRQQALLGRARPAVDRVIERRAVDAGGEAVALDLVPVAVAVDPLQHVVGNRLQLGHRRVRLVAAEGRQRDALHGRPAGVIGMVGESALETERECQSGRKVLAHGTAPVSVPF
jgi:hypothetical protein